MLLRYMKVLAALGILILGSQLGYAETSSAKQNPITAIDIALEPDATMIQHAEAVNARLRKAFPKGFALDATHHPHVSILQRYVHTADLDKVYDAVGKVLADEKAAGWSLKAFKYYYIPWKDIGLAGIVVEPTDDLLKLQQNLIDAVPTAIVERRPRQTSDRRIRVENHHGWFAGFRPVRGAHCHLPGRSVQPMSIR